jgi:hypothetical protein
LFRRVFAILADSVKSQNALAGCGKSRTASAIAQQLNRSVVAFEPLLRNKQAARINLASSPCENRFSAAC